MSLRTRLFIVAIVLLVTYLSVAALVVSIQRSQLIQQADDRLHALPPNIGTLAARPGGTVSGQSSVTPPEDVANPLSELYVGLLISGSDVQTLSMGGEVSSIPDVERAIAMTGGSHGIVTVNALEGGIRYRAIVEPQPQADSWVVAAQPMGDIDESIARLQRTLAVAGGVIALVLLLAFIWIQQLVLKPIAAVTATAEAISRGERSSRVDVGDPLTEAGKLGLAFNVMLDERDASDSRLRQFVADASHELRTPLTSVRGYLDLYRQGAFREQSQMDDVVRRLSAESSRMHGLVEDLLALASLDEGRPLRSDRVDLGQLLADAAQDAQAIQPDRSIQVHIPLRGPVVTGDANLLIQLVAILVSNALSHTPAPATIRLEARVDRDSVVVVVADNGPGFSDEAAERAFDRFWRGQSSRARGRRAGTGSGAGLGLAIARSIVDAHHGTIVLDSRPGEGSRFTITLPEAPPNSPAQLA